MICRDTPTHGWVCGWLGGAVSQWVGSGQITKNLINLWFGGWVVQPRHTVPKPSFDPKEPNLVISIKANSQAATADNMERLQEDHDNVPDTASTSQSSVSSESNDSTNNRPGSSSTEDGETSSEGSNKMDAASFR